MVPQESSSDEEEEVAVVGSLFLPDGGQPAPKRDAGAHKKPRAALPKGTAPSKHGASTARAPGGEACKPPPGGARAAAQKASGGEAGKTLLLQNGVLTSGVPRQAPGKEPRVVVEDSDSESDDSSVDVPMQRAEQPADPPRAAPAQGHTSSAGGGADSFGESGEDEAEFMGGHGVPPETGASAPCDV